METKSPFTWNEDGIGQRVERTSETMSHEVLFEDEYTHLSEQALFIGSPFTKWKFILAYVTIGILFAVLMGRAYWMQGVQHASYERRAEANRLRVEPVLAKRGIIRDRHGVVLAQNVPSFDIRLYPALLPADPSAAEEVLGLTGRTLGLSVEQLEAMIASSTDVTASLTVMRDITYEQAVRMKLLALEPIVEIANGQKRQYPFSQETQSLSHVLGYVGGISADELATRSAQYRQTDVIGKTGVESSYETILRGVPGSTITEVDARNRATTLVEHTEAIDGMDISLTLDADLQRAAEKALRKELEKIHLTRGSAIAMDPRDGSVLAMVSVPAYDNNAFSGSVSSTYFADLLKDPDHPLLPRAWGGLFPSGSTVKPVVATAALSEGVITPQTTVMSVGGLHIGATFFPDWKAGGHGITDVRKAIAWSVNTFFYTVGGGYQNFIGLGVDRLTDWMRRFGLGAKTGIDIPAENTGFVPSKAWKERTKGDRWFVGDTYNLSIGQGDLLVTPLQVANFTSEVANGGLRIRPHFGPFDLLQASTTGLGEQIAAPAVIQVVREGMRGTVNYGSGRALNNFPVQVAGKTGTAQWRNDKPNHAWFTSFAPYEKPEIVVTVLIEEGVEGSSSAVPVARDILQEWYNLRSGTVKMNAASSTSAVSL